MANNMDYDYTKADKLLDDLFENPIKFNRNKFKGYDLLNEYLRGYDIDTLVDVLKSNDFNIYKVGISIASELNEKSCLFLLPYLLSLIEKNKDPLYNHYLLSAIFKGTYYDEYIYFNTVVNQIKSTDSKVVLSVMNLIKIANYNQIKSTIEYYKNKDEKIMSYLYNVLNYENIKSAQLMNLIKSENKIEQLFGGIIAAKIYNIDSYYLELLVNSSNLNLKNFAIETIELKE